MEAVNFNFGTTVSFLIYIIGTFMIGLYFYKKTKDASDYLLGGRSIGPAVTALSAGASDMSAWLLLGLPGYMYSSGVVSIWIAIGLIIGAYLNWSIVASRLRVYTEKLSDSITISDYLENRFQDKSGMLRVISSVVILIFFTLYVSSGLLGGAKLFETTFGTSYNIALIVGSLIIVFYTFLGGYKAVCWTDLVQGLLMALALFVVPITIIFGYDGGISEITSTIKTIDPNKLDVFSGVGAVGIISLMAWGVGYFGQPHILVRFMSIKDPKRIKSAKKIAMSWMIISMIGALAIGYVGIAYFGTNTLEDSEKVFIILSQLIFNPFIAGILLAAILAAIMSTIDSQLLVSSSSLTKDLYKQFLNKDATNEEILTISRLSVLLIALIALVIAFDKESKVLSLVSYAWAGFGAAFGPVILLSLFSKKISAQGAIAGIITGAVTVVVYKNFLNDFFPIYEIVPGFILCAIVTILVSNLIPPSKEVVDSFDEIEAEYKSIL